MCMQQQQVLKFHYFPQKRNRVRVPRLSRRQPRGMGMALKNLKLYMENMSIIRENEKLRKQAHFLHQENLALMSEFQERFSKSDIVSLTLKAIRLTSTTNR